MSVDDFRWARALGCAVLVTLAVPAVAEDDPAIPMTVMDQAGTITRSRAVPAAGLIGDRIALDRRLAVAVREVCGYNSMHGLRPPADYETCRSGALADARRQAGARGVAVAALAR